jgi:hypothetical protein
MECSKIRFQWLKVNAARNTKTAIKHLKKINKKMHNRIQILK